VHAGGPVALSIPMGQGNGMGPRTRARRAVATGVAFSVVVAVMAPGGIRSETTSITPTSGVGDLGTEVSEAGPVRTITGGLDRGLDRKVGRTCFTASTASVLGLATRPTSSTTRGLRPRT
jgi:hypothetical protein